MLVPAGVLVLLMLGAIAVDSAVVFLAQRDLADRTAALANDVAGFGVADDSFYGGGVVELSQATADAYVQRSFTETARPAGYRSWRGGAAVSGRSVTVAATAEVSYLFARAVPGVPPTATVRASSTATARGG